MNYKFNLIAFWVVALMSLTAVLVKCNPVDFLTQFTDESDKMLLKSLAELFTGDYIDSSDESSASTSSLPAGIVTRQDITSKADNCRLPMKRGFCRALLPRWRYDPSTKTCTEFKFGGCDGNANNFKTEKECTTECAGV